MVTDRQENADEAENEEEGWLPRQPGGNGRKDGKKWRDSSMLPGEAKAEHSWRTRRIPLRMFGKRFRQSLRLIPASRRILFSRICNGAIRGDFRMDNSFFAVAD